MLVPKLSNFSSGEIAHHTTYDMVESEAIKLIDACETAIASFKCDTCQRYLLEGVKISNQNMYGFECILQNTLALLVRDKS